MSEHTPTPWSFRKALSPTDGAYDCGISAVLEDRPQCIAEAFGRCSPTQYLPAEDNAAFIVRACNAHDALVEALELADAALSGANMDMRVVENKARAALALAKGKAS